MNRRGLSAVVTTLIIILLVIVSTGIIWVVIKNLVSEGSEGISFGRFVFDITIKRAYMDGTDVTVSVRRSPGGEDLAGIIFVFYNGTNSITIEKTVALRELEERTFIFNPGEVPGMGAGDEVSVAPIYLSESGRETTGDITDTEEIGDSPPVGGGDGAGGGACTPDCVGKVCGSDGCGGSCGICADSICSPGGQCVECTNNAHCSSGYYCSLNFCILDTPINSGVVSTVWPVSARIYFDSAQLPLTDPDWVTEPRYASFDNPSEPRCILIFDFIESAGINPNDYSHIRLGVSPQDLPVNIAPGNNYEIWRTNTCGVTS